METKGITHNALWVTNSTQVRKTEWHRRKEGQARPGPRKVDDHGGGKSTPKNTLDMITIEEDEDGHLPVLPDSEAPQ